MDTTSGDMPLDAKKLRRIQGFRLMDDRFMRACLEDNIPCVQLVLRIILNKPDLTVLSARTQHPLESLRGKRSVWLDVFARDSAGRLYNLEIQRKSVDPERGRLNSALMDADALEAGEAFSRLPESWVIFIMERDPFGKNLPLYHFTRCMPDAGLALNDGSHIVYVNGAKRDGADDLSRLMRDFFCADPNDMYYEPLAKAVRHFKQTSEGVRKMSSVVDEIREEVEEEIRAEALAEGREEGRAEGMREANVATARQMLRMGEFTFETIAEITGLSLDEVRAIAEGDAG